MTEKTPPKTPFEKWKDGIDKAKSEPKWDAWDCDIRVAVNEYNNHLSGTLGYVPLNWQFVKAMLWVESGPHQSDWSTKPMQIGVLNDPGLKAFLSGNEGGDLILPPAWKGQLTSETASTIPSHNIRAGIGYFLMRLAKYEHQSVLDHDTKVYKVTVEPGDSFEKIARKKGSTPEVIQQVNPKVEPHRLQRGQELEYKKASVKRVITGWRPISSRSAKERYNSGIKDHDYDKKIDYALSVVRQGRTSVCAP